MTQNIDKLYIYTCVEAIKVLLKANDLNGLEQTIANIEEILNSTETKNSFNSINENFEEFKNQILEYTNQEKNIENKNQINRLLENILLKVEK